MKIPARGLSLIELIAVIAAIGTTSAVVLPESAVFQVAAESAALASLAGAASAAMAINQAGCQVSGQRAVPDQCTPISNCAQVGALLLVELPAAYRVDDLPLGGNGRSATCRLTQLDNGAVASFTGIAAGH